ncbi:MAG: dihydrofolate reductase family protein [Polyangiaceae bacterium]
MSTPSPRPRCSVFIATSLDGYIARSDGSIDWLSLAESEGEDYGYRAFCDSVDALVMGRNTYDTVCGFGAWPYADKRCIVLTNRRPTSAAHGEEFAEGDVSALALRLGSEGVQRVYVDGGDVIDQFLRAGLIDDMTISVLPILLGSGRRLFREGRPETRFVLESSDAFATGLVRLRYRAGTS